MSTRLGVNVNDETARALKSLAARHDTTVTEQVRRAVGVYRFFLDAQRDGKEIEVVTERTRTQVVIP